MKSTESKALAPEAPSFVEDDADETKLDYGDGGVPIYIAVAWVGFIVVYVVVMATLVLPDLRTWIAL